MENYSMVNVNLQINQMNYCGDMEDLYSELLNKDEEVKENIILKNKSNKSLDQLNQVEKCI